MVGCDELQRTIESITRGILPEPQLVKLLSDDRGLVRANALIALPRRSIVDSETVVRAVLAAANHPTQSHFRMMGTVTQRVLALATLMWMNDATAHSAYDTALATLAPEERTKVADFASRGPFA